MKRILVLGGTRFFGVPMVQELLSKGHEVVIATRGRRADSFGNSVERVVLDRSDGDSMQKALTGMHFDVAIDKLAYCSNDIRTAMSAISCDRYIQMSSTAVYEPKHINTVEEDFDALHRKLIWCDRPDFPYDEVKRQAECALWQKYSDRKWLAVRYPYVVGADDYTKRLFFYVEHVMKSVPMYIDNADCQMGYIRSDEAGRFMAYLADLDVTGAVNGCARGTISLSEIIAYVEQKTGVRAVLSADGEPAPYNGEVAYSINTDKAEALGFQFSGVRDWMYELLDYYIELVARS